MNKQKRMSTKIKNGKKIKKNKKQKIEIKKNFLNRMIPYKKKILKKNSGMLLKKKYYLRLTKPVL